MLVAAIESHFGGAPAGDTWGGILGEIQAKDPNLYVELYLLDKLMNGILFHDPNTTISWEIATRAQKQVTHWQSKCAKRWMRFRRTIAPGP